VRLILGQSGHRLAITSTTLIVKIMDSSGSTLRLASATITPAPNMHAMKFDSFRDKRAPSV
jgi:hypothetical protein